MSADSYIYISFTVSVQTEVKWTNHIQNHNHKSTWDHGLHLLIYCTDISKLLLLTLRRRTHCNKPPPRASGDSGRCHINCWRRDKLCGDLNSQPKRPGDLDLWPFDLEGGVRVTCATSVPILVFLGLFCSRLRPDVRDRQTDVRRASSLNAPT